MEKENLRENSNEITISTTLFRALFLLKLLLVKPLSIPEIKEIFINNQIIGPKVSDDTIRMTMATLKSVGCEFSKPSVKNNFRYKIIKSPFKFNLNNEDIKFLADLREQLAPYISWENLTKINDLYDLLSQNICQEENNFDITKEAIFSQIDLNILDELIKLCEQKIFISILYNSKNILKNMNIIPDFLKFENNSVYLWCYNEKRNAYSYLNVSRIKKINKLLPEKEIPEIEPNIVKLKINKNYYDSLSSTNKTKIIEKQDDFYTVEVEYLNEFYIIQKILELSYNCQVLEPENIRNKVIEKLKNMQSLYLD